MKVSTLSLLAVALIGISQAAVADTKIGFVNSDRVMREAAPAVRAQQRLQVLQGLVEHGGQLCGHRHMARNALARQSFGDAPAGVVGVTTKWIKAREQYCARAIGQE